MVVSRLVVKKSIPIPSQVGILITTFFLVFIPDSTTFATDPRVLELVTASVPVEHSFYKHAINYFRINICIENVYQVLFKHYNVNVYLEMLSNPKDRVLNCFVNI